MNCIMTLLWVASGMILFIYGSTRHEDLTLADIPLVFFAGGLLGPFMLVLVLADRQDVVIIHSKHDS